MRVKTTFLCGIDHIDLPPLPQRGERFADDYYITKDRARIGELISQFTDSLGSVETDYLLNFASAVIWRTGETEIDEPNLTACLEVKMLDDMFILKSLEMELWRVKDNACHFDRAWIMTRTNRRPLVHTNAWASRSSTADGLFNSVFFSREELRIARTFNDLLFPSYSKINLPTKLTKNTKRFERFYYFIGAARATNDLAMKIAQYCSGLEALVSTSQQELSHQVSERVAALLEPLGQKRLSTFKLIKQAYGYRSKAVHGHSFKPSDVKQLCDCSKGLDQACRRLFHLYFQKGCRFRSAVEGKDENATQFFLELLLDKPSTPKDDIDDDVVGTGTS